MNAIYLVMNSICLLDEFYKCANMNSIYLLYEFSKVNAA